MSRQNRPLTVGATPPPPPPPSGCSPGGATPTGSAASGTTVPFPMSVVPLSDPEIQNPTRGLFNWNDGAGGTGYYPTYAPVPEPPAAIRPLQDIYGRDQIGTSWRYMEPSFGVYQFDWLDARAAAAHALGGRYGFRIMTYSAWTGAPTGGNVMPDYIQSNSGTYGGTGSGSGFIPNSNNSAYLARIEALWAAIGARFGSDPRFGMMDIGMYGPFGEWWTSGSEPGGAITFASAKRIVDAHINNMPLCDFVALPGDNSSGTITTTEYCMSTQTSAGKWIGLRGDSWGAPHWYDTLHGTYWSNSNGPNQWQRAPVVGECANIRPGGTWQFPSNQNPPPWQLALTQVQDSHISMGGNGNTQDGNFTAYSSAEQQNWINCGKQAGYRLQLNSFTAPNKIEASSHATFTANWQNVGVAPPYQSLKPHYLLKNTGGVIVWCGDSTRDFKFMQPAGNSQTAENFNFPGTLPSGTLGLYVQIVDPSGYFPPLALANANRSSDGSYPIGTIVVP